jgi:large subunit ribosomal protein L25
MKQVPLTAKVRSARGSSIARRMRAEGVVPAEIYGHKAENQSIEVSEKEFTKIISSAKGENIFFALNIEGAKTNGSVLAVVKEIQYDKVSNSVLHADFHQVNMKEKIRIKIPVRVLNGDTCEGVKLGGVLQLAMRTIEVQCLPTEVPESIQVDAAHLNIGNAVHVSDLKLPEGVKAVQYAGSVVVSVAQQMAEEVKAVVATPEGVAAAAAVPGAAAEPEVLTAKKKEEGADAAKAGEKKPAEKK